MEENKEIPKEVKEVKPPSMIQMMKSFGRDLGTWVAQGAPATSPGDYAERLAACKACPHLIEKHMRCGKCGCLVEHKAKWRTTTCPDDPQRWKPQDARPKTPQEEIARKEQIKQRELAQLEREALDDKRKRLNIPQEEPVEVTKAEVDEYIANKNKEYTDYEDV